jgi:hypothetical protein
MPDVPNVVYAARRGNNAFVIDSIAECSKKVALIFYSFNFGYATPSGITNYFEYRTYLRSAF